MDCLYQATKLLTWTIQYNIIIVNKDIVYLLLLGSNLYQNFKSLNH